MDRRALVAALAAGAVALAASGPALAGDRALVGALRSGYPAAEAAATRAGDSEGTQAAYDAARELQEAVRAAAPVGGSCLPLRAALARYAAGRVLQMEGIDRPSAADVRAGARAAAAARAAVRAARVRCRGLAHPARAPRTPALSPAPGEAFLGTVVAAVPPGADAAQVLDGATAGPAVGVAGATVRFDVSAWSAGPHDVRVVFSAGGRTVAVRRSRGAYLLPASAGRAVPGAGTDAGLAAALGRALAGGPAYRAAWVQDLSTGRAAGVDAGAVFPAASTVKLGLLVGVLARLGPRPEDSRFAYDLRAMAGWSSNLATNRLVRAFGTAAARDGLRRLGTRVSTFTGEYIVGTQLQPALAAPAPGASPPRTSSRVTTAQDLGRMLYGIHASAVSAPARRQTGLTAHQARLALGWLLASQQRGDNASLVAGGAPPGAAIAQKNGWIRAARHGAAIVYAPAGPWIVVVMSADDRGVSLPAARALGGRVAALAR